MINTLIDIPNTLRGQPKDWEKVLLAVLNMQKKHLKQ